MEHFEPMDSRFAVLVKGLVDCMVNYLREDNTHKAIHIDAEANNTHPDNILFSIVQNASLNILTDIFINFYKSLGIPLSFDEFRANHFRQLNHIVKVRLEKEEDKL